MMWWTFLGLRPGRWASYEVSCFTYYHSTPTWFFLVVDIDYVSVSLYAGGACIVILYDTRYICVAGVSMQSSRKHHTLCACVRVCDWWNNLYHRKEVGKSARAAASRVDTVVQSCGVNPVWYERIHLQVLIFSPSAWDNRLLSLGVNYRCFQLIVPSTENR